VTVPPELSHCLYRILRACSCSGVSFSPPSVPAGVDSIDAAVADGAGVEDVELEVDEGVEKADSDDEDGWAVVVG
jgi:hypothetical protein